MVKVKKNLPVSKKQVLVIGAAGLDIVGRMINLPEPGASAPSEVRPSFGGVARNIAENLARLGQPVSLITSVGKDLFGETLLIHTSTAGVDMTDSLKTGEFNTASYLAVLTDDGNLQFALDDMRISTTLTPDYLVSKKFLFKKASLVFIDCNLDLGSMEKVFELAADAGIPVCADATASALAHKLEDHVEKLLLITANTVEAAVLCGGLIDTSTIQGALLAARHLVTRGAEIAVIPIAEYGVCYATTDTSGHIPAIHTAILDPTGAGDALTAAVIFGLMNDISLDETIRLGVSAASLTLSTLGTVVPDLSLEKLYDHLVI